MSPAKSIKPPFLSQASGEYANLLLQLGENAPARLLPILGKIQLESEEGQAPMPLVKVLQEMSYPSAMLEAGTPTKYKVRLFKDSKQSHVLCHTHWPGQFGHSVATAASPDQVHTHAILCQMSFARRV